MSNQEILCLDLNPNNHHTDLLSHNPSHELGPTLRDRSSEQSKVCEQQARYGDDDEACPPPPLFCGVADREAVIFSPFFTKELPSGRRATNSVGRPGFLELDHFQSRLLRRTAGTC